VIDWTVARSFAGATVRATRNCRGVSFESGCRLLLDNASLHLRAVSYTTNRPLIGFPIHFFNRGWQDDRCNLRVSLSLSAITKQLGSLFTDAKV
jgi:hypothetical protein